MDVFLRLPLATGLFVNVPKFRVVKYSCVSAFDLLDVVSVARYLGVLIGLGAQSSFWDRALGKFAHRCAAFRASPPHLTSRVARSCV